MTTNTQQLTMVIGSNGKTGRRVAERLGARGVPVRSASRSSSPPFDWNDHRTWAPALAGVKAAYVSYYPDLAFPGAAESVRAFVELAVGQGVERLVLVSGRGEPEAAVSERTVQESGVSWTVLRSSWFMQNFSEHFLLEPVLDGVIALPAGDVAEPFVDVDDLAEIAVAALTEDGHAGRLYELTGPRLMTFADVAADLSAATGREIRYVPITAAEYAAAALAAGVPAEEVEPLGELFATVLDGRNESVTDGIRQALGREPGDFADYARRAAATGVWATRDPAPAVRMAPSPR